MKQNKMKVELTRQEINTILWYLQPPANLVERDKLIDKLLDAKKQDDKK